MKKLICIFLSLLICSNLCGYAYADDNNSKDENLHNEKVFELSEYAYIKSLAKMSDSNLISAGYTEKEIADIRDYKDIFTNHIKYLDSYNDDVLLEGGYTEEQLYYIRNFDGSEEALLTASASMSVSVTTSYFHFDGDYTTGRVAYTWEWLGYPAFKGQDAFAFSWNNWAVTSNNGYVYYYDWGLGTYYTSLSATYTNSGCGTYGAGHKFNLLYNGNYYGKRGGGSFWVKSTVHDECDFYYLAKYGHSTINASISVSVSGSGTSVGISFSSGVTIPSGGSATGSVVPS